MKLLFALLSCCLACHAFAQPGRHTAAIDSLNRCIGSTRDTARWHALTALSDLISKQQPQQADSLAMLAFDEARGANNSHWQALARLCQSAICIQTENYRKAIPFLQYAIDVFKTEENRPGLLRAYLQMGLAHDYLAEFAIAIEYYNEGLLLATALDDKKAIARLNSDLALMYQELLRTKGTTSKEHLHELRSARMYYDLALQQYLALNDSQSYARVAMNKGIMLHRNMDCEGALVMIQNAYNYFVAHQHAFGMAMTSGNLAEVYYKRGEHHKALAMYKAAAQKFEEMGAQGPLAWTLGALGKVHYALGDMPQSLAYCKRAQAINEKIEANAELETTYEQLALTLARMGRYAEAFAYHQKFHELFQQEFNLNTSERIAQVEMGNERRFTQAQIAALNLKQQQDRQLRYLLIGGLIVISGLGALAFLFYRRQHRVSAQLSTRNEQISKQKEEIQHQRDQINEALEELRSAQLQLIQQEKLAATGRLVKNIAHELNSPIGVIRASTANLTALTEKFLNELPNFFRRISDEQFATYHALLDQRSHGRHELSTREERHYRRTLQLAIAQHGLPEDTAEQLFQAGVYKAEAAIPFLQQTGSATVLAAIAQYHIYENNLFNIQQAIDKTNRVVTALRLMLPNETAKGSALVDVIACMRTVLAQYEHFFKHSIQLTTEYNAQPKILCQPEELQQVFIHLIYNAIQALGGNGALRISIDQVNNAALIRIQDNGPGIARADQHKVFDAFYTTRSAGEGSGLGLYITKKIIENYGGTIGLESEPGKTVFAISWPIPQ